nr:hypothetical protein [Tanacetum cinerariifolium]
MLVTNSIYMIGIANALAARDADRSRNGEDSHDPGMGTRRQAPPARECTYQDFMKCKPLYFKGTEGVVELTQWFKRMETVFRISNCSVENQIKFATCTLLAGRPEKEDDIKESDKVERYVGGFPGMIHGSVVASRPKTMQQAIEMATELMDKRNNTFAERQAKNKRKFNDTSKNYQNQQQPAKGGTKTGQKPTCYECGSQGYYRSDCPELKNQNHGNQAECTEAHGMVHALRGGETNKDLNNMEDDINA